MNDISQVIVKISQMISFSCGKESIPVIRNILDDHKQGEELFPHQMLECVFTYFYIKNLKINSQNPAELIHDLQDLIYYAVEPSGGIITINQTSSFMIVWEGNDSGPNFISALLSCIQIHLEV